MTLQDSGKEATDAAFKSVVSAFEAGRIAEAADGFRTILHGNENHAGAWLNLGTALRKQGHLKASLAATKRALELKPDDARALTNLGNCLVDLDRLGEAVGTKGTDFFPTRS